MKGDPLSKLPTEPVTGTKMETLAEHLVSNSDDQVDDAPTFVPGKFVRLNTPVNLKPGGDQKWCGPDSLSVP